MVGRYPVLENKLRQAGETYLEDPNTMTVDVYADILFLINAAMDGLCLILTGKILHRRLKTPRVLLGAALGGIYAVLALLLDLGSVGALLLDVGVCLLLCTVVFTEKRGRPGGLLFTAAVFYLLSMLLGGVMTALYNLFNRLGVSKLFPPGEDGPGVWLFGLLALLGSGITLLGGRLFKSSGARHPCCVTVELEGRRLTLDGLVDTGNLLRDPLSGKPVICADLGSLEGLLSPTLAEALRDPRLTASLPPQEARRIRLIPVNTATGSGMLSGFVPDRLWVRDTSAGKAGEREVQAVLSVTELTDARVLVPGELMH